MPLLFGKNIEFGATANAAMIAESVNTSFESETAYQPDENGQDVGFVIYNEKCSWTASGNPLVFGEGETPVYFPIGSTDFPISAVLQPLWSSAPAAVTTVVTSGGKTRSRGAFATADTGGVVLPFTNAAPAAASQSIQETQQAVQDINEEEGGL